MPYQLQRIPDPELAGLLNGRPSAAPNWFMPNRTVDSESSPGADCIAWTQIDFNDKSFIWAVRHHGDNPKWTFANGSIPYRLQPQRFPLVTAFDYEGSGQVDHILTHSASILSDTPSFEYAITKWEKTLETGEPVFKGRLHQLATLPGFEYADPAAGRTTMNSFAIDWESSGLMDHVALYINVGPNRGMAVYKRSHDSEGLSLVHAQKGNNGGLTFPGNNGDITVAPKLRAMELDNFGKKDAILWYYTKKFKVLRRAGDVGATSFQTILDFDTRGGNSATTALRLPMMGAPAVVCVGRPNGGSDVNMQWILFEWSAEEQEFKPKPISALGQQGQFFFAETFDYLGNGYEDHIYCSSWYISQTAIPTRVYRLIQI